MEKYTIRKVMQGDENALAFIQTESWKAAFNDIVQEDLLAKCTELDRVKNMYRQLLTEEKGKGYLLEVNGKPHCIAYWDSARESDMSEYAELICIHSLQDNWCKGYGSKMMERILNDVRDIGFSKIMLWVFEKNYRAIAFYKKYGFKATERKQESLGNTEIMYEKIL